MFYKITRYFSEMMGMYLPQQVSSHQMFLQPVALTRLPQYKIAPGIQQHNPQHNPHALLPQVAVRQNQLFHLQMIWGKLLRRRSMASSSQLS